MFRRSSAVRDAVDDYIRRARVLRQIQSNKAHRADIWERVYLVLTVLVTTVVSVIGFAGADRISVILNRDDRTQGFRSTIETIFNISVLLVLIATLVGLVFRFGERANRHYRSLEILTDFMRDCTDQIAMHDAQERLVRAYDLDVVRTRYKGILATLPPSSDKDYARAKADDAAKREKSEAGPGQSAGGAAKMPLYRSSKPRLVPRRIRTRDQLISAGRVARIFAADDIRMRILRTLYAELGSKAWIAGGFVREAVWDSVSGRKALPPGDDVDVIYFDRFDTSKEAERALQAGLTRRDPTVRWSVKNQARMHLVNGDQPYTSLQDAVARFPETASAVALQLGHRGLKILAPIGLEDLVELRLQKGTYAKEASFRRRLAQVASPDRWPLLEIKT